MTSQRPRRRRPHRARRMSRRKQAPCRLPRRDVADASHTLDNLQSLDDIRRMAQRAPHKRLGVFAFAVPTEGDDCTQPHVGKRMVQRGEQLVAEFPLA